MKKIISVMLAIAFVFTLSACGKKDTSSDTDTSTPTQSEAFTAPENYASVLLITINPQFKLYLDENNNVLAVEPINDDAKTFSDEIDFENKSLETVVETLVEKANEKGFVKENVTINFEITEQKTETVSKDDILQKAVAATEQKATELNIEIKTEIKESNNSQTTEANSENTQISETSKSTNSSEPTKSSKPTESTPTHTHKFSAATCTAPQKCSCGETKGSALGHKWQDATCQAPKTCSVCKATTGNVGNHKYTNGKCIYCGDKQIINPKTGLKENADYYHVRADGEGYYTLIIWQFDGKGICTKSPDGVYSSNEKYKESGDAITYKGITYYPIGSGGPLPEYTLTDTEIILKYSEEFANEPYYANVEYRLIVNYEYDLEVTYSSDGAMFKKGDILDLAE